MIEIVENLYKQSSGRFAKYELIDQEFLSKPIKYTFQCILATLTLFTILIFENALFSVVIVVAVASSAFTIFVFPYRSISTPRKVIGGYRVKLWELNLPLAN